jgi:hypothetical protein
LAIASHHGWSLRECYERVDSQEFTLWLAYYAVHGWPETRADYRNAYAPWVLATIHGSKEKIEKFIPRFDEPPKTDWRVMQAKMIAFSERQKQRGK